MGAPFLEGACFTNTLTKFLTRPHFILALLFEMELSAADEQDGGNTGGSRLFSFSFDEFSRRCGNVFLAIPLERSSFLGLDGSYFVKINSFMYFVSDQYELLKKHARIYSSGRTREITKN